MAKQRNSLGMCVITAPTQETPISWDDYKKEYGLDLSEIFVYFVGDGAGIRIDFSKILCIDFRTLVKSIEWKNSGETLLQFPVIFTVSGDDNELLGWGSYAVAIEIDALNKTIKSVEL